MRTIAKGSHADPAGPKCLAEWFFLRCFCARCSRARRNGVLLTDAPPCLPHTLSRVVPAVNDRLAMRDRLAAYLPLLPSLEEDADPATIERVERRLALWSARRIEHLADSPVVAQCNDATELYIAGEIGPRTLAKAQRAAERRARSGPWRAAVRVAYAAARAAETGRRARISLEAAAAAPAWELKGEDLLAWFEDYLEYWIKQAANEGLLGFCSWIKEGP